MATSGASGTISIHDFRMRSLSIANGKITREERTVQQVIANDLPPKVAKPNTEVEICAMPICFGYWGSTTYQRHHAQPSQ